MPAAASFGAVGELAASRHGAFTRRQAADIGMDHMTVSRLVRRGVLTEPAPGVLLVRGAPPTFEQLAYSATLAGGGHGLVIGEGSARMHVVDGFIDHRDVLVAIPRGGRMPLRGVTATQRREQYDDDLDVVVLDGIPCSSLARTVADLARFRPSAYERAADDFQRRGFSLDWLEQTVRRMPRRRGDGLDMVLADLDRRRFGGSVRGSWFERFVEVCTASPRIPPVVRQYEVRTADGRLVGRPDLAIPSLRLAIEAHSRQHHTGPTREAFDEQRDNQLAIEGWHTSYVGWAQAATPVVVRRVIERIVERRAADLGVNLALLCGRRSA